jgi:hypothetical protein
MANSWMRSRQYLDEMKSNFRTGLTAVASALIAAVLQEKSTNSNGERHFAAPTAALEINARSTNVRRSGSRHARRRARMVEIADFAEFGAPRPMKMGTIASPWRYDAMAD